MKKKTKILLINPPTPFLAYPNAAPHLGIGYLISFLRKYSFEVKYLNLESKNPDNIILPEGFDFYGISSVSAQYHFSKLLLTQIKRRNLGKTILGGTHASIMAESCLNDGFDYVVKGYGEKVLLNIVDGNLGVGIHQGFLTKNLDEFPFPAWDDLLQSEYDISYGKGVAHMFSLRGCPYTCSYCASAEIFGTQVGFRSIENVIREIKYLKNKYSVSKIYFLDPTFTINRARTIDLCSALKVLDVKWTCETRVDRIDTELLRIMYDSGCDLISYGIETGSTSTHGTLSKNTTMQQNKDAIKLSHEIGLKVKAFLMGALPSDDQKTNSEFQEFLIRYKPDTWLFSTFIPFPGTDQWNNPARYGINIINKDFRGYYNLGLNARGPINFETESQDRDSLRNLRDEMLKFLRTEIPNPRVEYAISQFEKQKQLFLSHLSNLDYEFFF